MMFVNCAPKDLEERRYLGLPGTLPIEGGLPITMDNQFVGAIGVSGVRSHQDAQIAQAGLNVL